MSGEFKYFFLTMGNYDMVAIYEAPDDARGGTFQLTDRHAGKDAHAERVS
jgi:uncharacterized protein with GYD domain